MRKKSEIRISKIETKSQITMTEKSNKTNHYNHQAFVLVI